MLDNGDVYVGIFDNNMANGTGVLYMAGGDIYEGEWMDDKLHGHGKQIISGNEFEGLFQDGIK